MQTIFLEPAQIDCLHETCTIGILGIKNVSPALQSVRIVHLSTVILKILFFDPWKESRGATLSKNNHCYSDELCIFCQGHLFFTP